MWSFTTWTSNCNACFFILSISSGPWSPSLSPGQFSTSVVVVSCPPSWMPAIIIGFKPARAAYIPAAYPAGPEPKIINLLWFSDIWWIIIEYKEIVIDYAYNYINII